MIKCNFFSGLLFFLLFNALVYAESFENNSFKTSFCTLLKQEIMKRNSLYYNSEIIVDFLYIPKKLEQVELKISSLELKIPSRLTNVIGKLVVPTFVDGKKNNVIVSVKIIKDIVVASANIKKYDIISSDKICIKKYDLSSVPSNVILDPATIIDKESVTNISKDTIVLDWMIRNVTLGKKDSDVQIVAKTGDVTVKCTGKLLQDSSINNYVWVQNPKSKKKLKGILVDSKTVIVDVLE
ncbi:MAG: flagella basal body P-ring formation protein FlgA [Candidatus Margulisiibacteriota bacterium]|nr:MAG: flagella basal body P-ring formation protein FlgA [Candidatus Margulisbacteria bacterium GWD2_39_127]OGI01039.1 MAG: flagella basal body P-ring formation protein FlgA [Candidatus Margulisbacteria bacterium GWF2_38_17]PZM82013.1 MAG: flagella basal body P-ring formation protein FlgA [Candidatus Margulisiibacteriota bacterium]HCY35866.1 flagella basal body P-ring formation protein FlgA [Candidatus Margulisiibacteriota bacterium]